MRSLLLYLLPNRLSTSHIPLPHDRIAKAAAEAVKAEKSNGALKPIDVAIAIAKVRIISPVSDADHFNFSPISRQIDNKISNIVAIQANTGIAFAGI